MNRSCNEPENHPGPPLKTLYFYVAQGCNLKCRHCWINPDYLSGGSPGETLHISLFKRIIREAVPLGLRSVKLTGGEPLLHPRFMAMVDVIHDEKLTFIMETNGLLCDAAVSRKIAGLGNAFVSVSLDGADAQTHEWVRGVPGCFEAAKTGITHLVEAGINTQIIMSVMAKNHGQIEAMVRMAEDLGVESVKFNLIMPTARGERMHQAGQTLSIEKLVEIGHWVETELAEATPLRLQYSHPPAFRPLSQMLRGGNRAGTCDILGVLGVLSSGAYALCGIGEHIPALVFGRAGEDPLETVWRDTPVLRELREGIASRSRGICGDCILKARCLGSCIAQNYYSHRDLWAPFWYCEAADKAGLFPGSRRIQGFQ